MALDSLHAPPARRLDLLGRVPIPLRHQFKHGIEETSARHLSETGEELAVCLLSGVDWHGPFDRLAQGTCDDDRPSLIVSTLQQDLLTPRLLASYAGSPSPRRPIHPVLVEGGLVDRTETFHVFSVVPFVFLVDTRRLQGRPAPRTWSDLLHPMWHDEIVFGGWRPRDQGPYRDYNSFIILSMFTEFGAGGLSAFSSNVRGLVHNVRTTRLMGTSDEIVGSIAILPWLHARLSPRRERVRVIWPEDGALAMPIVFMAKPARSTRIKPLVDYLASDELVRELGRNCYPSAFGDWPADARLKWHGWPYLFEHDVSKQTDRAADLFFSRWREDGSLQKCA